MVIKVELLVPKTPTAVSKAWISFKCFKIFITHSLEDGGEYRALRNVSISFYFTIIQHRVRGAIVYDIGVIANRGWFGLRVVGCNEWLECVGVLDMGSRINGCMVKWTKY